MSANFLPPFVAKTTALNSCVVHYYNYAPQDRSQNPFSVEPYSKRTAALIDIEVQRLVAEAFQRAMALIKRNELKLRRIVDRLLEKEVLSADELKAIIALDSAVTSSYSSTAPTS